VFGVSQKVLQPWSMLLRGCSDILDGVVTDKKLDEMKLGWQSTAVSHAAAGAVS